MIKSSNYKLLALKFLLLNSLILGGLYDTRQAYGRENINKPSKDYIRQLPDTSAYIIGPGDILKVKVSEDTAALNKSVTVDSEGIVNLERLKRIYVSGLNISELTEILNNEYSKYVKEPNVELFIVSYRPVKFYIDGEVEEPGLHILSGSDSPLDDLSFLNKKQNSVENSIVSPINNFKTNNIFFPSLIDAIRISKGITQYADMRNIKITRVDSISNGGGRIGTKVNLIDTLDLKDDSQNVRIFDGDMIFIPKNDKPVLSEISKAIKSNINPKFVDIFLGGRVEKPGPITVSKSSVLLEAIQLGGGTKFLKGKVNFLRYNNDGTIDQRVFSLRKSAPRGSYQNPFLKNGDLIYVGKSPLNITTEILTEITSPISNIVSTYGLFKIIAD